MQSTEDFLVNVFGVCEVVTEGGNLGERSEPHYTVLGDVMSKLY